MDRRTDRVITIGLLHLRWRGPNKASRHRNTAVGCQNKTELPRSSCVNTNYQSLKCVQGHVMNYGYNCHKVRALKPNKNCVMCHYSDNKMRLLYMNVPDSKRAISGIKIASSFNLSFESLYLIRFKS